MINNSLSGTASISAMNFRKQPGTYLDQVDLKQMAFIIERAGKPKAVLVSMIQFEQFRKYRQESKDRLFKTIEKIRKNTSKYKQSEVQAAIDEATNQI
ncbi:MAG: type II toxin-antitoxin system Phd/YefM family antitoxin [Patescibacteria group bacterium]